MSNAANAQKASMLAEVEEGKNNFWCVCGKSAKQPFCDGSHKDTGVSPVKYMAKAAKKCFFVSPNNQQRHRSVTAPTANHMLAFKLV